MSMESPESQRGVEIPDDLWIEVLARVPNNSVYKFRSLSKFHKALIGSPNFMQRHLELHLCADRSSSCSYHLLSSETKFDYLVKKFEYSTNFDATEILKFIRPGNSTNKCVGCCKGILLFQSPDGIMLWNPLTRASRSFPHVKPPNYYRVCYYLGHDAETDDLKILKVMHSNKFDDDYEIYSSKRGSWRKSKIRSAKKYQMQLFRQNFGVFVKGSNSIHMLGNDESRSDIILAFDFSSEKFSQVASLPPDDNEYARLSVLNGCLCVYNNADRGKLKMWMMKDYGVAESWTQILIDYSSLYIFRKLEMMPLDFVDDGQQCLVFSVYGLHSYNLEKKRLKKLASPSDLSMYPRSFVYTPSLRRV